MFDASVSMVSLQGILAGEIPFSLFFVLIITYDCMCFPIADSSDEFHTMQHWHVSNRVFSPISS